MPRSTQLDKYFSRLVRKTKPRAGSLIITLFGDAISQHGNNVWLGSIIDALTVYGINSRQVRTAVFRLVQDDWLEAKQIGRRSFYSLTAKGLAQYQRAARRIYAASAEGWNEEWTLVFLNELESTNRDQLRRELFWLGFRSFNSGTLAHPNADQGSLQEVLERLELGRKTVVMNSKANGDLPIQPLMDLSHRCWELAALGKRYSEFVDHYSKIKAELSSREVGDQRQIFELRTLMIHEYRRILLKSPELPDKLLPPDWAGTTARDLVADLYSILSPLSMQFIQSEMVCEFGNLASSGAEFRQRFC